jgi:ABC-type transport system involved in multi-copper enzyme maturation permease subunit
MTRLELRKSLRGRRLIGPILLSILPILMIGAVSVVRMVLGKPVNPVRLDQGYAVFFQTFFLRFLVFFGCAFVFTGAFRGDMLEKTLHYYLLAPVRREILAAGKFLAGLLASSVFFGLSTIGSFLLMELPLGRAGLQQFFLQGPGLGYLGGYLGITGLACLGYGAVFILFSVLFRNPVFPALTLFGLESINFLLPGWLKQFSVVYYLQSLSPVPLPPSPLALMAEPTPPLLAVLGLVGFAVLVLVAATLKIRRMEVIYAAD